MSDPAIQRALLSVSDKRGLAEFARSLSERGVEILSTGGSAKAIREGTIGVRASDLISVTGEFSKGDVLHVYDEKGEECARGLTNFSAEQTLALARAPDEQVEELLGFKIAGDVINRGNLVVLEEHHLPWEAPEEEGAVQVEVG